MANIKIPKSLVQKIVIIGINDSQGVNITPSFFKKGMIEYLEKELIKNNNIETTVIDAHSLTMNKTEHIDYFLENNLTLEEIKLSQIYSVVSALEKIMTDIKLPKFLGGLGNAYRLIYSPKKGDDNIRISTALRNANTSIVIYSSGVNNLMREVGANPAGIKSMYKNRDKKPNYNYTLEKTNDPKILKKVIDRVRKNFDTILKINPNAHIYALGIYVPKALESEEMNIFRNLIIAYNEELAKLCDLYGVTFIDMSKMNEYNKGKINFHISTIGHNALAHLILENIYKNNTLTIENNMDKLEDTYEYNFSNDGAKGVIKATELDYEESLKRAESLDGYARQRELAIAQEHKRETEVFKKVLKKKRNR